MGDNTERDELIEQIRAERIGPVGPNSLEILARGGYTHMTPSEAAGVLSVVEASGWLARVRREAAAEALEEADAHPEILNRGWLRARAAELREVTD